MNKVQETEKQKQEKLKALRREIEEKLEEQLPQEMLSERNRIAVESINTQEPLDPAKAKQIFEALLFASSKPMTAVEIRKVMKSLKPSEIEKLAAELKAEYETTGRSFEIREIAGGWEVATRKEFAPWLLKLEIQKKAKQATQSALETLAILAYKQPITKAEIEELRGVDVTGVLDTLVGRGLIKIVGKKEVPGRPFLYGTTEKFLEHFGLRALTDLPNIEEIRNLVENSVKKEDLFQNPKMISITENNQTGAASEITEDQQATEDSA
ncbi:MAG: SMC-Scp complex subunit ScpB [Candidatus Omnitrophica bacterium]|nr:SMC-Scp complex subunit ScpB [Candidatus Omnitrophota bacterium]